VFVTLQSTWFQKWSPELTIAAERMLFAALPVVTVPLVMSVIVGMVGIQNAPFYLCGILCLYVHLFSVKTNSSFKVPGTAVGLQSSS
jgi:hypothetical protein